MMIFSFLNVLILTLISLMAPATGQTNIISYDVLMTARQNIQHTQANYTETRHVSFLDKPVIVGGKLEYEARGFLKKTITTPDLDILEFDNGQMTHTDKGGKSQTFSADLDPILHVSTSGLMAFLSGNNGALESLFHVTFGVEGAGWLLHLRPKNPNIAADLLAIRIFGIGAEPNRIEFFEASGDQNFMAIATTLVELKND